MNLRRPGWLIVAFVGGAALGLWLLGGGRADQLTREGLAEARSRWASQAPAAYTLELEMRGALNERRTIVVADGRVVSLTAGGAPAPPSSWEYWSVEGLFDTLETEIANAADPRGTLGAGQISLLVRFEPTWGYPSYFYRHIQGSLNDVEWEVVGFTVE